MVDYERNQAPTASGVSSMTVQATADPGPVVGAGRIVGKGTIDRPGHLPSCATARLLDRPTAQLPDYEAALAVVST